MKKPTIQDLQEIARKKGGKCLSEKVTGITSPLKWQCVEGHTWETSAKNVKKHNMWCPICATKKR